MDPDSILGRGLAAKFGVIHFPWGRRFMLPARLPLVVLWLSANLVSRSRCCQSHFGKGTVTFSAYPLRLLVLRYILDRSHGFSHEFENMPALQLWVLSGIKG